ncbi:hypothetical protein AYO38_02180 [bacterium SCGC AG-212-C10]|nr:hypothetical protein AYO38_02180 [bacterium SCGC AG-212-C10]
MATAVLDVTDATFATEVLDASMRGPVVVDFWAPWCGPCRVLGPIIEKVAAELGDEVRLVKLNTDENPRTATQFRIQGIPAVKAFKDGKLFTEFTGALPEPQVRAFFAKLVPSPIERMAREAEHLRLDGDPEAAERMFREVLRSAPSNVDAIVGLAAVLVAKGETAEAEELLERAPGDRRAKVMKHSLWLESFAQRHAGENLESAATASPRDPKARYRWGLLLASRGKYELALDELLESVRLDKAMGDGAARKAALAIFDILGPESPVVREYQRKLSGLLF